MVARIEHPHVVPLYDYWREPDRAYLVMRWMTGGSLEARLDDGAVVARRHRRRWSTRSPRRSTPPMPTAWCTATSSRRTSCSTTPAGRTSATSGSPSPPTSGPDPRPRCRRGRRSSPSPEQLRREPVGPEADVHALGIVAYTLLTGRTPFADSPDEPTMLRRQLHDPIPSARASLGPSCRTRSTTCSRRRRPSSRATGTRPRRRSHMRFGRRHVGSSHGERDATPCGPIEPVQGAAGLRRSRCRRLPRPRPARRRVGRPARRARGLGCWRWSARRVRANRRSCGPDCSRRSPAVRVPGSDVVVHDDDDARRAGRSRRSETALLRVAVNPPAALLDQLRDGDRGILRAVNRILPDDDGVVAIVIDQFEELFTAGGHDADRDQFLRCAGGRRDRDRDRRCGILLTLRADFYDRPLRHPEFAPLLKQHTVVVTPLAPDELEHAIVTPAAAVGVDFEPGLVAEIVADVNHEPGGPPAAAVRADPGVRRHRRRHDHDRLVSSDRRTHRGARPTGRGAVPVGRRRRTVGCTSRCSVGWLPSARARGHPPARAVVRARRRSGDLRVSSIGSDDARLLTFDHDPATREPTVEVAHEALIREWPRLRSWLDDDRDGLRIHRHLTETAATWIASDRDDGELYRGGRLEAAEHLGHRPRPRPQRRRTPVPRRQHRRP